MKIILSPKEKSAIEAFLLIVTGKQNPIEEKTATIGDVYTATNGNLNIDINEDAFIDYIDIATVTSPLIKNIVLSIKGVAEVINVLGKKFETKWLTRETAEKEAAE